MTTTDHPTPPSAAGEQVWLTAREEQRLRTWPRNRIKPQEIARGLDVLLAELDAEARRSGVADALAITAPTSEIARAYAASDVVLQLSRKPEAFGRTVVESLSVGRPVVGWAHGGVGELLAELQPQGAVPAFDAQRLFDTVMAMLAHPPSRLATMETYTLRAMQDTTLALYLDLADDRPPAIDS